MTGTKVLGRSSRPKTGGRKKGTPNKLTQDVIDKLMDVKCDPILGMAEVAKLAMQAGDIGLAGAMYKELAQYVAPKRRSIEVSGNVESNVTVTKVELVPLERAS